MNLLDRLKALRDIISNPAIPDALERAGHFLLDGAAYIRKLQGSGETLSLTAGEDLDITECEFVLAELRVATLPEAVSTSPAAALDPASWLLILELASKVLDWIKSRRNS